MLSAALGLAVYLAVTVLFATWATTHILLCLRLAPLLRVRALVGLLVLPLAPYYGLQAGFRKHAVLWSVCSALYLGALTFAWFV